MKKCIDFVIYFKILLSFVPTWNPFSYKSLKKIFDILKSLKAICTKKAPKMQKNNVANQSLTLFSKKLKKEIKLWIPLSRKRIK